MKHKSEFMFKVAVTGEWRLKYFLSKYSSTDSIIRAGYFMKPIVLSDGTTGSVMFLDTGLDPSIYIKNCNLIVLCCNPNKDRMLETLDMYYEDIKSAEAKIICVFTKEPKNSEVLVLAKAFAQGTKICDVLSMDQFFNALIEFIEDQLDLCSILATLKLTQYNEAFKDGSEIYAKRNFTKLTVKTFFGIGPMNYQEKIMAQRMPIASSDTGCYSGLYRFLKDEGTLNKKNYKRCGLEVLFPKLERLSHGEFLFQVKLLEIILDRKLAKLKKEYEHIYAFSVLNRYCDKGYVPYELKAIIKQNYVDLTVQEESEAVEAQSSP